MDIGKPKRKYTIEPIRDPVRRGREIARPAEPPPVRTTPSRRP